MNFKNDHCSVCDKPLLNSDDIVVCPECGTPYHRECYAKTGHCLFADKHGTGYEYKQPGISEDAPRCANCGTPNAPSNLFCENCGIPIGKKAASTSAPSGASAVPAPHLFSNMPPQMADTLAQNGMLPVAKEYDGVSTADWAHYIGNSAPYYLFQFDHMDKTVRKTSVCWSALFMSPVYFFFRKMWGWAALSLLGTIVVAIPSFLMVMQDLNLSLGFALSERALSALSIACMFLNWGMSVFFGLYAFYLFRKHAAKKLLAMKAAAETELAYQEKLARHAGPSKLAVAALVAAVLVLSMLFSYWIGPDKIMSLYY